MSTESPQYLLIKTIRHALLVLLLCYVPQWSTAPGWLILVVLSAVAYRLIADYWGYPLLNRWIRMIIVFAGLFLLKAQYGTIISSGFFVGFLLLFVGLKSIEIHSQRDLKVLVLCNFYLIAVALIVTQELWIIAFMMVAILANFSLMMRLNAPLASLRQIGSKSGKLLLIAIPISMVLFYVFPRIAQPLWNVPSLTQSRTGFSERMTPGSITELFSDDSTVLRITFKNRPEMNGYWRGLILSFYDGRAWSPSWNNSDHFPALAELADKELADYQVILEPRQTKWLFYQGKPIAGDPKLAYSPNSGLISTENEVITQRFAYALKTDSSTAVTQLNEKQRASNTKVPNYANPRLKAWAKEQYLAHGQNTQSFILFLQQYIQQNNFWYTLNPPAVTSYNKAMDQFWFDTQKGYCEHYASAVAIILRASGIPARVVVGYQGGEWNPVAQYLTIRNKDAHAWLEYWQEGAGWQQFDPTSFVAAERVDESIRSWQDNRLANQQYFNAKGLSYWQHAFLLLDSARFFAERWLLFYNQDTQNTLLEELGLGQWSMAQLLQTSVACIILFIILVGLAYQWKQSRARDPLKQEYHLLQKEFRRLNVATPKAATLKQQCRALIKQAPQLASMLSTFLYHYEQLRLRKPQKNQKKQTILLFKTLRKKLNQTKINQRNSKQNEHKSIL